MKPKLARKHEPTYYIQADPGSSEEGPFLLSELRELAASGGITPDTRFRREDETELRPISSDAPLAADLWQEDEPFDPETAAPAEPPPSVEDDTADRDRGFDTSSLLQENVERARAARAASGVEEERPNPLREFWALRGALVRWIAALVLLGIGIFIWIWGGRDAVTFFFGVLFLVLGLALVAFDLAHLVSAPFTGLVGVLFEGTGGGSQADYWTADSLLAQGEYNLALAEYRKIALQYPREVQAYIKGIRCARTIGNQKEADRLYELAMKNLRSDQDRNLFISSVERMQ